MLMHKKIEKLKNGFKKERHSPFVIISISSGVIILFGG